MTYVIGMGLLFLSVGPQLAQVSRMFALTVWNYTLCQRGYSNMHITMGSLVISHTPFRNCWYKRMMGKSIEGTACWRHAEVSAQR